MNNNDRYLHTFVETFPGLSHSELENLQYQSVQEWDSIGHLTLIASIEQAFEISLDMDDIIEWSSFKKGKEILKKYHVEF